MTDVVGPTLVVCVVLVKLLRFALAEPSAEVRSLRERQRAARQHARDRRREMRRRRRAWARSQRARNRQPALPRAIVVPHP